MSYLPETPVAYEYNNEIFTWNTCSIIMTYLPETPVVLSIIMTYLPETSVAFEHSNDKFT
jgi:hypothetical protein